MFATIEEIADVIAWRPALAFEGAKLARDYRNGSGSSKDALASYENPARVADLYEAGIRLAADRLILRGAA